MENESQHRPGRVSPAAQEEEETPSFLLLPPQEESRPSRLGGEGHGGGGRRHGGKLPRDGDTSGLLRRLHIPGCGQDIQVWKDGEGGTFYCASVLPTGMCNTKKMANLAHLKVLTQAFS